MTAVKDVAVTAASATAGDSTATQRFRHVRLALTRRQYPTNTSSSGTITGNGLALAEFRLTLGDKPVDWDGATLDAEEVDEVDNPNCGPAKIMDGSIDLNNKWFYQNDATEDLEIDPPFTFDFDAGEGKDFVFDGYQLATADVAYRNPPAWAVYGSDDGTAWTVLDTRSYTDADARALRTYTWQTFSLNMAASEPTGRSISLNVANGTNTYTANLSGDTAYGLVPVPGKCWVNLFDASASAAHAVRAVKGTATVTRTYDAVTGTDTALGVPVSVTFSANNAWTAGTSAGMSTLFHTYLDDCMPGADGSPAAQVATIAVKGVPFARYDVIVYFSTGSKWKINASGGLWEDERLGRMGFSPVTVNGETYSWRDGALVSGEAAKGLAFGESLHDAPELGVNALRIPNLSGDLLVRGGPRNREVLADGRVIHSGRGTIAGIQIVDLSPTPSISVNFVGNNSATGNNAVPSEASNSYIVNKEGASGLVPVPNSRWLQFSGDNVSAGSLSETITNAKDSYGNATTASITANMGGAGSFYALWNTIGSAREGRIGLMGHGYREPTTTAYGTDLTLKDIPYPRYDLLLYFGTDVAGKKFNTVAIKPLDADDRKRVKYSYPENAMGDAAVASGAWGSSDASRTDADKTATLGTDVMRIRNLSGDIEVDVGEYKTTNDRGGLCGFQIVYAGELRKAGALNLNFVGMIGDSGVVQADETLHGLYPAPGTSWINLEGASGTDVAIANAYETDLSGRPSVSYASTKISQQANTQVTILRGCIEEGNVTVENVPYEMYDVIVYMTTSSYGMAPVMVNGAYYTWEQDLDNTSDPGHTILSHAHGPKWGPGAGYGNIDSASAPEYGVSALRINAQTAKTLTVRPQLKQGHWVGTQSALAAIQIVERIKVPVDGTMSWADATAGIDPSAPIYIDFGPNGHITDSSVTLPENAIVDFEESDLSKGTLAERPFTGELVTNTSTELRLPSNVGQYSDAQVTYYTANVAGSLKTPNGGSGTWTDDYPIITIDGIDDLFVSYMGGVAVWINNNWQDRVWTGAAGDGDWTNPDNWLLGMLPTEKSTVLIPVKDGEEVFIDIPEDAGTVANVTITGQGDSGLVSVTGKFPVADSGKVTVEGKVTIDGSAFVGDAIAIDGDVTLGAGVRPLPVITKGDTTDPYGTVTIQPTSEEALKGGTVILPAGSGLIAGDIYVEGIDQGAVTVTPNEDGSFNVTWKVLPATLSINFGSNVKAIPDEATVSDFGSAVKPVIAYTSRGVGVRPTNIDPILSGSLDTADITVRNVPYEKYDVIVYYATSYKNGVFPPVKVNGTYYTWDEAHKTGYPTTVNGPSFGQGGTSYVGLGVNAQRIYGLTDATLNVVSHKSFNKDGKYHRGCIAGIQIVRRVVLTVDSEANWGDISAGIDTNTPIEVTVLPGGSITGNVDLTVREDVIIDLTGFDFSTGDQPFDGTLTVEDSTTILLPTNQEQYRPDGETVKGQIADSITGNPILGLGDDRFQSNDDVTLADGAVTIQTPSVTLPTVWTGAGDGTNWNDPDNWSTGVVPGADTNVVIPVKDGDKWSTGSVPESGVVVVDGETHGPITVTLPEGDIAEGITQVIVKGDVTFIGEALPPEVTLAPGAIVTVGGTTLPEGWELPVDTTLVVTEPNDSLAGATLDGKVVIDLSEKTTDKVIDLGGADFNGGLEIAGDTSTVILGTVDDQVEVSEGAHTIEGAEGIAPDFTEGGAITVADDAEVVLGPDTNWDGVTLPVTGGGTLDIGDSRPTLDGNGPKGELPSHIVVTPTQEETEAGAVTIPVTEGTSLPGDFTVTVGDKTYGKDAVTVEDGNLVVDLDKPLAPSIDGASIVDALPDDLVDDLNAAASEGGLTGNYEVKVETAGQEVADLDAEQLGSILDAFEGLVPEVDQEANTLTYTYAFGIAAMAVSEDGTWRVTVQVASGERAVAFAAGSAYTLTVTPWQGEQRTLTFADEGVEAAGTPDTVILVTTELPQEGDFALKIAITPPARK